jgi:CBS domain-containing protein
MKAADIMIHSVFTAKPDETVMSVLQKFVNHKIGGMPIVNDRNEIVGYISDGDIMRGFSRHGQRVQTIDTGYYVAMFFSGMTEDEDFQRRFLEFCRQKAIHAGVNRPIYVSAAAPLEDVARVLGSKKIKKVPIVSNGQLVGIISRGDVMRKVVERYIKV